MSTRSPADSPRNRPVLRLQGLRCGHCGHELTGVTENRCPECGRGFIPGTLRYHQMEPLGPRLGRSLLMTVLFPPLGIIALVFSLRAERARHEGRLDQAFLFAQRARYWRIIAGAAFGMMLIMILTLALETLFL